MLYAAIASGLRHSSEVSKAPSHSSINMNMHEQRNGKREERFGVFQVDNCNTAISCVISIRSLQDSDSRYMYNMTISSVASASNCDG